MYDPRVGSLELNSRPPGSKWIALIYIGFAGQQRVAYVQHGRARKRIIFDHRPDVPSIVIYKLQDFGNEKEVQS